MLKHLNIPETLSVPQSFRDSHYCLGDVLRLLNLDHEAGEFAFWHAYKSGLIPAGVWLDVAEEAFVCWEKAVIDNWLANDCPAYPGVVEHEQRVRQSLIAAISKENPQAARILFANAETN